MESVMNIYANEQSQQPAARTSVADMVTTRQAQEVQAAMVIAKRFPRDEVESYNRIIRACKRVSLAEQAMYEYPRGKTKVTGPSIRLAEMAAQNWGNIDYGIIELEQRRGESQVMAYAWDLETNTRQTKIFTVPHIRETKNGNVPLTDPRDIYEMVANQGARRVRACILGVIPGDVIESAIDQCNATLQGQSKEPLIDTIRKIVGTFKEQFGVDSSMLEKYIGCKTDAFSMTDLIRLKKVYRSLCDGMAKREDYFDLAPEDKADANPEIKNPFANDSERKRTAKGAGKREAKPEPVKEAKAEEKPNPGLESEIIREPVSEFSEDGLPYD